MFYKKCFVRSFRAVRKTKKQFFTFKLLQCGQRKVIIRVYFQNRCENWNSKTTLWSKTFDFAYWGTFSTPNSEVFAQENFSNFWKILIFQKKMLLKKFSNANSRPIMTEKKFQIHFSTFFWPIILISGAKNFFRKVSSFQKIFY